ncbi:hypothetical protein [Corynebacterium phoceense]
MTLQEPATPDELQVCRRPEHRASPGRPNVWETTLREMPKERKVREHRARVLCLGCPALDWCEERLAKYETAGIYIDGVVAARYSDVAPNRNAPWQATCLGCGRDLVPMHAWKHQRRRTSRDHLGEGYCRQCHPLMSRTTRQNRLTKYLKDT